MPKVVKVDLSSIKSTFKEMNSDAAKLGLNLLVEAEFMKKTLKKLKKDINKNGVITEMKQGEYSIERANPSLSQYNSLVKNYNSTIKQIFDLLSTGTPKSPEDEFDDFNK